MDQSAKAGDGDEGMKEIEIESRERCKEKNEEKKSTWRIETKSVQFIMEKRM